MWFGQEASYILSETKGQRAAALSGGRRTTEAWDVFLVPQGVAGRCCWLICVSQAHFPCLLQVFTLVSGKRCISLLTWGIFLKLSTTWFSPSCAVIKLKKKKNNNNKKQDINMTFHYQVSLNKREKGKNC